MATWVYLSMPNYVSRAGDKLEFALDHWHVAVTGLVCADLGCSTGGFTDCLLQRGAAKVYSVDTGYGVLAWKLRQDPKVVVLERANALHVVLPELVDLVTIDVSWTPQKLILPAALKLLKPGGQVISLIKPHYESKNPRISPQDAEKVAKLISPDAIKSPLLGEKGGNTEYFMRVLY